MQKLFGKLMVATLLLAMSFGIPQPSKAWPAVYSSWANQQLISFNSSTPINNYQVGIYLDSSFNYAGANSDGSDIRFADLSDNVLNYYIEKWNDYCDSIIWVKVPSSGTSQIYMYYGNSSAISESNGTNVFDFFDDFTGSSLDSAKWDQLKVGSGSVSVSGGMADIFISQDYQSSTGVRTKNSYQFGEGTILESRASIDFDAIGSYGYFGYSYSNCHEDWWICFNDSSRFNDVTLSTRGDSTYNYNLVPGDINVWHNYKIIRSSNQASWYRDGTLLQTLNSSTQVPNYAMNIYFGGDTFTYSGFTPDRIKHHYLDWVRIRKFSSQEVHSGVIGPYRRNNHIYDDWRYRKSINLSSSTSAVDVQIPVKLTSSNFDYSKVKADGSDIRFADLNVDALDYRLHYWIENWNYGGDSKIWVKIPNEGTSAIYMYFGNDTATSESNGKNVFEVFDDFDGSSLDPTMWNVAIDCGLGACSATVHDSMLDVFVPAEYAVHTWVQSKPWYYSFGSGYVWEIRASMDFGGVRNFGEMGFGQNNSWHVDFVDNNSSEENVYLSTNAGSGINGVVSGDVNIFHRYKIVRQGSHIVNWYIDDTQVGNITDPDVQDSTLEMMFGGGTYTFGGLMPDSSEHHYLDWIRLSRILPSGEILDISYGLDEDNPVYISSIDKSTTVTATVPSSLTFTINPVALGQSVNGVMTNIATTTGSEVNFGTYVAAEDRIAAHDLIVSTNATNGYQVNVKYDHHLSNSADYIPDFIGTNIAPINWTTPPGFGVDGYFGYTTSDIDLYALPTNRFNSNKWAGFYSDYDEVVYFDGPVENQSHRIGYRLEITDLQAAGNYSDNLMYLCTATY